MIGQLRSELLKQRSTSTTRWLMLWLTGLAMLVVALHVLSFSAADLAQKSEQLRILGLGTTLAAVFGALLGALSISAEFRTGTIRPTLLITPLRTRVIAAKLLAGMIGGLGVGVLAATITAAGELAGLAVRGIAVELSSGDLAQIVVGGAAGAALFAVIGVGVGAAVRNQVASVVSVCVWLLFVEPLLLANAPAIGKYAPEASAGAMAGAIQTELAENLVTPGVGLAVLATFAAVATLTGSLLIRGRDID